MKTAVSPIVWLPAMSKTKLKLELLSLLKSDARMSSAQIAQLVGVKEAEVETLIEELKSDGVIVQFATVINDEKLKKAHDTVRALIELEIRPEKKSGFDNVAKRISQFPNVVDHYLISGRYDFLIIVEGDSLKEVASFISDKLASIENVRSTTTHFILKKYKEHGAIFDAAERIQRLAVSP